jgi:hypothetical protein
MLQFTLPLYDKEGQKVASMKTVQVFILSAKDFDAAVDYLSKVAAMQHCQLNEVLQNLRGASNPKLTPISKPHESPGNSNMGPPMVPLMARPLRPLSQTPVYAPLRHSPLQSVHRSQTARPGLTIGPESSSRSSSNPYTAIRISGQTPLKGIHYWSSPLIGSSNPRSSVMPSNASLPPRLLSADIVGGDFGERNELYGQPYRVAPMRSRMSSHPLRHDAWGFPPSTSQVETSPDTVPDEPYHGRFPDQSDSHLNRILPRVRHNVSNRTPPAEGRPLSRLSTERPASRSSAFPDHGIPIKIKVLSLTNESRYSGLRPEIPIEFTLHLLPSTKMYELCLHAASYIRNEWHITVDGRALVAQRMDGSLFEDCDILSDEALQGQAINLVERRSSSTAQRVPIKFSGSYLESLHPGLTSEMGRPGGSYASTRSPVPQFDETDQVPPPRQLPFRSGASPAPQKSSSTTTAACSPLEGTLDLINASATSRTRKRPIQPVSPMIRTEEATTKQPNSSQKRLNAPLRRPASSVSDRRSGSSTSEAVKPSEARTSVRQPKTSLGIRRKRKTPLGEEGVPAAIPPSIGSLVSDTEVSTQELATSGCMRCRNKKRKCDRSQPACGVCLKQKMPCTYPNNSHVATTTWSLKESDNRPISEITSHPMMLRSRTTASPSTVSDALAHTYHPREYKDIGSQTQGIKQGNRDVEMKDMGTDPHNLYTDASTETERCEETWLPFSQSLELIRWGDKRLEEQLQKAAEVLATTDPFQDDYQEKVAQAAVYALEFEEDFRGKEQHIRKERGRE